MKEEPKEPIQIRIPTVTLATSWESDDPWVERIWLLTKDVIEHLDIDESVADQADFAADRLYEKFQTARNHYQAIKGDGFVDLPTSKQETEYEGLYSALWSAYKDRFTKIMKLLGYDIGFMFSGSDYEQQAAAFAKRHPSKAWLVDYSKQLRSGWQGNMYKYRNAHDHDGDLRGDVPDLNDLGTAKEYFEVICYVIEGIFAIVVEEKLRSGWLIAVMNDDETVFGRENRFTLKHIYEIESSTNED